MFGSSPDADAVTAMYFAILPATITAANGTVLETSKEKGLDIFQRQPDGNRRISVSYAFPLS